MVMMVILGVLIRNIVWHARKNCSPLVCDSGKSNYFPLTLLLYSDRHKFYFLYPLLLVSSSDHLNFVGEEVDGAGIFLISLMKERARDHYQYRILIRSAKVYIYIYLFVFRRKIEILCMSFQYCSILI